MVPWPLYVSDLVDPWWIPCQNRISKLPRGRFGGDCSIQPLDIGLHIASDSVSQLFVAHLAMGQRTCSSPGSAAPSRELPPSGTRSVQLDQRRRRD